MALRSVLCERTQSGRSWNLFSLVAGAPRVTSLGHRHHSPWIHGFAHLCAPCQHPDRTVCAPSEPRRHSAVRQKRPESGVACAFLLFYRLVKRLAGQVVSNMSAALAMHWRVLAQHVSRCRLWRKCSAASSGAGCSAVAWGGTSACNWRAQRAC